jgi:hypothetical protein
MLTSGSSHHVVWCVGNSVSEKHAVSVFRINMYFPEEWASSFQNTTYHFAIHDPWYDNDIIIHTTRWVQNLKFQIQSIYLHSDVICMYEKLRTLLSSQMWHHVVHSMKMEAADPCRMQVQN